MGVFISGIGMTAMNTRDQQPDGLVRGAIGEALVDSDIDPRDIGLVVFGNAMGGRLNHQGCIRGQTWMRGLGIDNAGVINIDNSCASGSTALHAGYLAVTGGESPVLVVGVEKMWIGDRLATLAGIADALPYDERLPMEEKLGGKSIFMEQNAQWVNDQVLEHGTTVEEIALTAVKSHRLGALNPLAQIRTQVTLADVLNSGPVAGLLTRLMCSSFTDGAAALVLTSKDAARRPRIAASVARSGSGQLEYHDRIAQVTLEARKVAGIEVEDVDLVEVHDATSGEELYALEALGFFKFGDAGRATKAEETMPNGNAVCVNPSGGLVSRGHPLGATGLCQVYEIVSQLRGQAGQRQVEGAQVGMTVNTGGIISGDTALASAHVLVSGHR
jgi:acetyl-CoA acetyltransferase